MWGECVKIVVFLMNRTPSPILQHKSPYEIMHQQLPNYSDFKTFGTLCYASTLLPTRHKFSPRATATVFIGYPHGYKGYKLLDLTTLKTFISRGVKFYEHIFPFKDKDSTTSSIDPLSPHITPNLITLDICDDPDPIRAQQHPDNQPIIQNYPHPNPLEISTIFVKSITKSEPHRDNPSLVFRNPLQQETHSLLTNLIE